MSGTVLKWLHISDIHLRDELGWAQDAVLAKMLDDITARYRDQSPDMVFITGDIAFSGKASQYAAAEDFINRLRAAVRVESDRVFIVPGNHDIDRELEEDAYTGARKNVATAAGADQFFAKESRRQSLFRRQAQYRAFANRMAGTTLLTDSSYCHYRDLKIGALRVRVLLLDTAWLAGGDDDMGNLLLGERQLADATRATAGGAAHLTFALMHHPFAWLQEWEALTIENAVVECTDICLRGHVHVADQRATETLEGRTTIFTAGAAFETRLADNTYNWATLDLLAGGGKVTAHRYVAHAKRWDATEPRDWTLVPRPLSVPLPSALSITSTGCRYPNYAACLISGVSLDVPIRIGERECFVGASVDILGAENHVGAAVERLWHHCHWRDIWAEDEWGEEASRLIRVLDESLSRFATAVPALQEREAQCATVAAAIAGVPAAPLGELQRQFEQFLAEGEIAAARSCLERWRSLVLPSAADRAQLARIEIKLLISERRSTDSLSAAKRLSSETNCARDYALAAACAQQCGESREAATLMHQALDRTSSPGEYSTLALAIAGSAGDASLVRRVRS